jgi:hypothetical protein
MDVHIPQAGNQKFAGCIDHGGARRGLDILPDRDDASCGDNDGNVRARRRASRIDDSGVLENKVRRSGGLRACGREKGNENNQPEQQTNPYRYFSGFSNLRLMVAILRLSKLLRRLLSLLMPLYTALTS